MRNDDPLSLEEGPAAIERYRAVLAAHPRSQAFGRLAEAYRKAGRYGEAIAVCEEGLQYHPSFLGARLVLARSLAASGRDLVRAEAEYRRILEVAPDSLVARRELGDLLRTEGRAAEALVAYESFLEIHPFDGEVQVLVEGLRRSAAPAAQPSFDLTEELTRMDGLPLGPPVAEEMPEPATSAASSPAGPRWSEPETESPSPVFDFSGELEDAPALPGRPSGSLEEAPAGPDDILATETLADLYVQQGFGDEARAIYEELVRSDPERADLQAKLDALQEPPGEGAAAAPFPGSEGPGTLADILEAWLLAARSRRAERQDGRR